MNQDNIFEIMQRVKEDFKDSYVKITLRYVRSEFKVVVDIKFLSSQDLLKSAISASDLDYSKLYGFVNNLYNTAQSFVEKYKVMFSQCVVELNQHQFPEKDYKFTEHSFGVCKYASIGKTQYCWLKFISSVQVQWMKVYFSKSGLSVERTKTELAKDKTPPNVSNCYWDGDFDQAANNLPPNVWRVSPELQEEAMEYIKANSEQIYNQVSELPLNRTGMRESVGYATIIFYKDGANLVFIKDQAVLANPNMELWVAILFNTSSSKTIKGFACPIADDTKHFELQSVEGHHYRNQSCTEAVIKDHHLQCFYEKYRIAQEVKYDDEYFESIFKASLLLWNKKGE